MYGKSVQDSNQLLLRIVTITSTYLCRLLITFANHLDPDQAEQNIKPELDPSCLILARKFQKRP